MVGFVPCSLASCNWFPERPWPTCFLYPHAFLTSIKRGYPVELPTSPAPLNSLHPETANSALSVSPLLVSRPYPCRSLVNSRSIY